MRAITVSLLKNQRFLVYVKSDNPMWLRKSVCKEGNKILANTSVFHNFKNIFNILNYRNAVFVQLPVHVQPVNLPK